MKKTVFGILIGVGLASLVSFTLINYEPKKSTAEVEQMQGVYIFTDSKPVSEYEYLGTVKRNTLGFGGSQYADVRDGLIKRAKEEYIDADGIILILQKGSADRADVIKFK